MPKQLIIVTGSPGSGAGDYAEKLGHKVFSREKGNISEWRDWRGTTTAILVTSAPKKESKQYWMEEAKRFGFSPRVVVIDPGRSAAEQQITKGKHNDMKRKRLAKTVARWHAQYSPHPDETNIYG